MRNVVITVVAVVLIMVSFLAGARVPCKPETPKVPETTSAPVEMGTPVYVTKCTKVVAYKYCSEYTTYKVHD